MSVETVLVRESANSCTGQKQGGQSVSERACHRRRSAVFEAKPPDTPACPYLAQSKQREIARQHPERLAPNTDSCIGGRGHSQADACARFR